MGKNLNFFGIFRISKEVWHSSQSQKSPKGIEIYELGTNQNIIVSTEK